MTKASEAIMRAEIAKGNDFLILPTKLLTKAVPPVLKKTSLLLNLTFPEFHTFLGQLQVLDDCPLSRVLRMSKDARREILGVSKITYKFQVTVPKEVRERFQLREGETIVFILEDGRLFLAKSTEI
jgi:AbrB family looped-hinge helix DNA binding protein